MNIKRVISASIIAVFITPSLYAGPCINCVATVFKRDNIDHESRSKWSNDNINVESKKNFPSNDYIDGFIPLEDNAAYSDERIAIADDNTDSIEDEDDIILTYDVPSQIDESTKILYACEDIINNIVACDEEEEKGGCECV